MLSNKLMSNFQYSALIILFNLFVLPLHADANDLHIACFQDHLSKVKELIPQFQGKIDSPAKWNSFRGFTPLMLAIFRGNLKITNELLAAGADPEAISKKDGFTPLLIAIEQGNPEIVQAILKA